MNAFDFAAAQAAVSDSASSSHPASSAGPAILGRLMDRHPLTGIADRAAAA